MNKVIRYGLLFLTLSCFQGSTAVDYRESFSGREWEFLQYKFKVVPNNYQLFRNNGKRFSLLLTSGAILSGIIIWFFSSKIEKSDRIADSIFGGIISGLSAGLIIPLIADRTTLRKNEAKAFLKFIKKWPKNKNYTPLYFHDSFEQVYDLYTREGETPKFKREVRKLHIIVMQALNNRFSNGYYSITTRYPATTQNLPPQNPVTIRYQ